MVEGMKILRLCSFFMMISVMTAGSAFSAEPTSYTKSADGVTATVAEPVYGDDGSMVHELAIRITRNGETIVDNSFNVDRCPSTGCITSSLGGRAAHSFLLVRNIDADPDPEVVVGLNTGGVRGTFVTQVFDWRNDNYATLSLHTQDASVAVRDLGATDDQAEFVTVDARFSARYAPSASSWLPIRVFHFEGNRFTDVTSWYQPQVRSDSRRALTSARRVCKQQGKRRSNLGLYAGWAANEYRLGKRSLTLRTLRSEQRRGCLLGGTTAQRRTFITRLDRDLRRFGYAR